MGIRELVANLYLAKQQENEAKERRVALEAELSQAVGLKDNWEGSMTKTVGEYKVELTRKMDYKIDAQKLIEQARVNNMLPMLETCFRRKYEIAKKGWKAADEKVRLAFAPALTVTPRKASFTVERMAS